MFYSHIYKCMQYHLVSTVVDFTLGKRLNTGNGTSQNKGMNIVGSYKSKYKFEIITS